MHGTGIVLRVNAPRHQEHHARRLLSEQSPASGNVFEIFLTAFDQAGAALRVTVTVFPTDRNQFIINVGDVPDPTYEASEQARDPGTRALL
jgi:hypothetical protein